MKYLSTESIEIEKLYRNLQETTVDRYIKRISRFGCWELLFLSKVCNQIKKFFFVVMWIMINTTNGTNQAGKIFFKNMTVSQILHYLDLIALRFAAPNIIDRFLIAVKNRNLNPVCRINRLCLADIKKNLLMYYCTILLQQPWTYLRTIKIYDEAFFVEPINE